MGIRLKATGTRYTLLKAVRGLHTNILYGPAYPQCEVPCAHAGGWRLQMGPTFTPRDLSSLPPFLHPASCILTTALGLGQLATYLSFSDYM